MIFDTIGSWELNKSRYGNAVTKALDHIRSLNTDDMPATVEIDGRKMYVMKQSVDTVKPAERQAEVHAQYTDIHLVLKGEELQGHAPAAGRNQPVENQLEQKDYALFEHVEDESFIMLRPGCFTVYWPGEFHRPNCSPEGGTRVEKLVVKIHRDLLD